jgi:rhodanese-related sulfurtransferase
MSLTLNTAHAASAPPTITPDALRLAELNKEPNLIIVDVRDANAFIKGHIQHARNILASNVPTSSLPLNAHIIVYCSQTDCDLSSHAAQGLIASGYPKVSLLDGGFDAWLKKGYPSTTGPATKKQNAKRSNTSIKDARQQLDNNNLFPIDTRTKLEFSAAHLPHALNAPLEELESHYIDMPKDKQLLIYDSKAQRSRKAYDKLKAAGFTVTELSGGIAGWARRKQPLEVK